MGGSWPGLVISASQDVRVQVLCNFINQSIGAYGATLDLERPSYQRQGSDRDSRSCGPNSRAAKFRRLIVAGANPVTTCRTRRAGQ